MCVKFYSSPLRGFDFVEDRNLVFGPVNMRFELPVRPGDDRWIQHRQKREFLTLNYSYTVVS